MKNVVSKVTSNPIGAVAGAAAGFFGAKKLGGIHNMWALAGAAIAGAVGGAYMQSAIKAEKGAPTAASVNK